MRSFALALVAVAGCSASGLPIAGPGAGGNVSNPPRDFALPAQPGDMAVARDGGGPGGGGAGGGGSGGSAGGGGSGGSTGSGDLFAPLSKIALPTGYVGESVAIGDVTGDGRNDVVVGAWGSGASGTVVFVFAQLQAGKLDAPVMYPVAQNGALTPRTLALGDLDGDGRLDVAVARLGDVGVLYQTAEGALAPIVPMTVTQSGNGEEIVAIADFNADGRADLVATGWASSGVDVWLQNDAGMLIGPQSFGCPHNGYDDIAIADFDGNGLADLVLAGEQSNVACLLPQQAGSFLPYVSIPLGKSVTAIAGGDVDGDGRDDLVAVGGGNGSDAHVGVALQPANGTPGSFAWMASTDIPGDVIVGDVDRDGRNDVIVLHTGWNELGVYLQDASGALRPERIYAFSYINWGSDRMAFGDINGDDLPDLVAVDAGLTILMHR
jgi:hypothetical protein